MNKNDFTHYTRACKEAKAYTGHRNLRCSSCPFEECLLANPRLKKEIFVGKIAELTKAFGYTRKLTLGSIFEMSDEK